MKIETVGLVGFGRFGKMAHHYLSRDKEVRVYDLDPQRLKAVPEAASLEEALSCSMVLLCVPISALEKVCRRIAPQLKSGQIVVDTCSVKQRPVEWMTRHLPSTVQILGTHPLFGPDSGRRGIEGLKIALCPARVEPSSYRRICRYLEGLGLVLAETTPQEHDRQIAQSQAIFHLIAQALKCLAWDAASVCTPGPEAFYRLVKTVQNDTDQLFFDMEVENPQAAHYREQFIRQLVDLNENLSESVPASAESRTP